MFLCSPVVYFIIDIGLLLDLKSSNTIDPGFVSSDSTLPLDLDFTPWYSALFCCEEAIMPVCINCNLLLRSHYQWYLIVDLSPEIVMIVEEWCRSEVTNTDHLCQECMNYVLTENYNRMEDPNHRSSQQLGHICVCICCGISLSTRCGRRRYRLLEGSVERNYVENHIFPRQVPTEAWACHACWLRAHFNVSNNQQEIVNPVRTPEYPQQDEQEDVIVSILPSSASTTVPSSETDSWAPPNMPAEQGRDVITLINYKRTPDTPTHCFVPDCTNMDRIRVPVFLKKDILANYKLYITPNARVCQQHITVFNWEMLSEYEFTNSFNREQIEDMLNLSTTTAIDTVVNFEKIETISSTVCQYWTGLSVINFMALYNQVPQLTEVFKKAKTALGLYLVKLRTGEPIRRMASQFLLSRGTVASYIKKTRDCLTQYYVPLHLGISHMTREGHSARNLLIPQGLFGSENNNPIVICDGTYIYFQKSSNYLFQKKTYSLHKYRNLVKPFLMVACDGHIIDAFGPYAATDSDADIMKSLFQNADSPLRSYFRNNDIFILDRGFRDALGLLSSLGYTIHKPESLSTGESQLSTIKANKSRYVTLCRWVVEVINGRFKRDFKIFRGNYFNVTCQYLMANFRIASAILNNFHPIITNRNDAQLILNRALERMNVPNLLSEYVNENRLNRQRANFTNINAQLPELNVFPTMEISDLILFSLGTYQLKQARSYYGEHIRENGTFRVEVDTNLIDHSPNRVLMRGRIKSRHISSKTYLSYILLNLNAVNWCQRICEYYCTCIIGKRTVGCCVHTMTIVWYLGWARHQENPILPPASFLDDVLVREDLENE